MASKRTITLPAPAEALPQTETAQRFLDSACSSVQNTIDAMDTLREVRREKEGKGKGGQLADSDMDLLRMAIVFAGAGIDATLKQLARDAIPDLAEVNGQVSAKFRDFVDRTLAPGGENAAGHRTLVSILLSDAASPRAALLELYIGELVGNSLQSAEELDNICGALGISNAALRKRIAAAKGPRSGPAGKTKLRQLFEARNEIVHELDLQVPGEANQRRRRPRAIKETIDSVKEGLETAQLVINEVASILTTPRPSHLLTIGRTVQ
mgnify:CR=1 FL=1